MRITGSASSSTKCCRRCRRWRRRRRRRCRPLIFVSMTSAAGERQIEVLVSGCWESSLNNYMRAAEATRLQTGQPGLLRRCHNGQAEHIPLRSTVRFVHRAAHLHMSLEACARRKHRRYACPWERPAGNARLRSCSLGKCIRAHTCVRTTLTTRERHKGDAVARADGGG